MCYKTRSRVYPYPSADATTDLRDQRGGQEEGQGPSLRRLREGAHWTATLASRGIRQASVTVWEGFDR